MISANAQQNPSLTENGANEYLKNVCYPALKKQMPMNSFLMFSNMASDDTNTGGGASDGKTGLNDFDLFSMTTNNSYIQSIWTKYYAGITTCNTILDFTTINNSKTDQYKAEAYFMRAYFYFDLVKLFGRVPLYTSALMPLKPNIQQASSSETYNLIESDLKAAIPNLPLKSALTADEKYRITKGAAQALLAKVYLFQNKYAEATNLLKEIINTNQYSLLANYADLWLTSNKFSKESILEFPYSTTEATWGNELGNFNSIAMGVRTIPTSSTVGIYKVGFGLCAVTKKLADAFIAENDYVRLKASIITEDTLQKLGYTILKTDINSDYEGYYDNKHTALTADLGNSLFSNKNEIVIRYADVLLMCAEALAKQGNDAEAQMYINMIRYRVNLPAINSTGATLLNDIYKERRLELALEGNRFNDLIRWGLAEKELGDKGYKSFNNIWPIPELELMKNPNFMQNPGYMSSGTTSAFTPSYYIGVYFTNYKNDLDSIIKYEYNINETDSLPTALFNFTKKANNILEIKYSKRDIYNDKWVLTSFAIDTLNSSGKLLSESQYQYNFSKSTETNAYWDTTYRLQYQYNNEKLSTNSQLKWGSTNIKDPIKRYILQNTITHFIDKNGNDTLSKRQDFDATGIAFSTIYNKYALTYNENNKLTNAINFYLDTSDTTKYTNKNVSVFDENENITQSDFYFISKLLNSSKNIYQYNSNKNILSNIQQVLDTTTNIYHNSYKNQYILNNNNQVQISNPYNWNPYFNNWMLNSYEGKSFYYYKTSITDGLKETTASDNSSVKVWPNPVSDIINIDYVTNKSGNIKIQLFTIDGKLVYSSDLGKQFAGNHHTSIDATSLNAGTYTIQVSDNKGIKNTKKIIIKK
jgi:hypothetical protein